MLLSDPFDALVQFQQALDAFRTSGWLGADGNYSVTLSKERTLWFFSDTWLGDIENGHRKNAKMINNSVGVMTTKFDDGKVESLLAALQAHVETNDEARKCFDYVTRNRHRMRYPEFRAQGLCVSTGVVESGCKVSIGTRLKRSGMHWTVAGADAIIALRCCRLSGRMEDFWERRAVARSVA